MGTTAETIATWQIRALRSEAAAVGDEVMVDVCDVALGTEDSDGTGTVLGRPMTVVEARTECARVIAENEAES